ncbi:MAG: hypothetical protein SFT81_04420 [Candidatus Caenarcaniphilales bacterium]|nr:hypothetical protein [Candidatus Caenarcaniphilales bacterium]
MNGQNTSDDKNENLYGALCYLFGMITGIIFFLKEPNNRFIRFHAVQSIAFSLTFTLFNISITFLPDIVKGASGGLVSLLGLALWVYLMYQAYQGLEYKLPVLGDFAEKEAAKIG